MMHAHEDAMDGIKVFAFVGPAGTGKSQRAQLVADHLDAEYIIDDGLVIRRTMIVAGKSAKTERNQIRAIRRAMFEYEDHRKSVLDFFERAAPCSVMIIATSDGMALKIADKLGFPHPSKIVYIDEVATPEEIARARKQRKSKRQHVIPVSHVQVSGGFAGKMVGRLRVLWKSKSPHDGEKTIVRPPFSFYGDVRIEPEAIAELARAAVSRLPQIEDVHIVRVSISDEDELNIDIELRLAPGAMSLRDAANDARRVLAKRVSYLCGLEIGEVNALIKAAVI